MMKTPPVWLEPLVAAALFNVVVLLLAAAMMDMYHRTLLLTLYGSAVLWIGLAVFAYLRPEPSRFEKVLVAISPLILETALIAAPLLLR
jgi:hypothetical protein